MKIVVFGATGKTGQHVVRQALDAGHEVVALARTPSKLGQTHARLSVVEGDISQSAAVARAIHGADAVISTLGPASNKPEFAVSQGMAHILSAMQQHNVQRLVMSAGAGVRDPQDKPKPVDHIFGFVLRRLSANVVADMEKTVGLVRASDRDWTIVRVPRLTDGAATGQLRVGYVGDIGTQITRTDMAAFMLRQLEDTTFVRQAPAISN